MKSKRGQGLSVNALVLIVLAIVVLVILILGFSLGWSKLLPFLGKGNNINDVVTACDIACSTGKTYDFCSKERTLKSDDLPGGKEKVVGTCQFFASNADYVKYGIKECPGLC